MIMKISTMILIEIKKRDYDNKTEKQNNKNIKRKRKDVTFNITLGPIDNDRHKSRKTNRRERKFIPKETIERETTEKPPIEKDSNIENGDKDTNEPVDHPTKKADKCLFYPNCTKPDCPFFFIPLKTASYFQHVHLERNADLFILTFHANMVRCV